MQINKTKRVRSATFFRSHQTPRARLSLKTTKTIQKEQQNIQIPSLDKLRPFSIQHNRPKESEFRTTIRKLSASSSKKSIAANSQFIEYNSESWRTVNSARSLTRLQSLKQFKDKDPIKINLQQKVLRIKSKHKEKSAQSLIKLSQARQGDQSSQKAGKDNENNLISNKINEILIKWQKEKKYSTQVYRKKIQLLAQQSQSKFTTKKVNSMQPQIKWEIS